MDFEILDDAAPNKEQRKKRRRFYLRNGYRETGLFLSYLGVDYEAFCMGEHFDTDTFKAMMKNVQVEGFDPKYFTKWKCEKGGSALLWPATGLIVLTP